MNREQKAAAVEEIAEQIKESDAVFAVDYRGITVAQAAEIRGKLRESDATFRIVKNTLTLRSADQSGAQSLLVMLEGPTAITFIESSGHPAAVAKADICMSRENDCPNVKLQVRGISTEPGAGSRQVGPVPQM